MGAINTYEWMDPKSGLLSAVRVGQPKWPDLFPDTLHHTCIFLMREYLSGNITIESLEAKMRKIWSSIYLPGSNKVLRFPGSNETINRDQSQFLVPLLREAGMESEADFVTKEYAGFLLPHWRDWFNGRSTWWGRVFEWLDVTADRINFSETSAIKNIIRYQWWGSKGVDLRRAISALKKLKRSRWWILVVYFSRTPELAGGKSSKDRLRIFDDLFERKKDCTNILVTDWPPIYESFKESM